MPLVRTLRKRGTTITVEAHGESLFVPGGEISQFTRRFSARLRSMVAIEAPDNKRPRWAHYGLPLKRTMRASTVKHNPAAFLVSAAVGSTAAHAYYVDQGTGIYGGNGPYQAKILPPWTRGSPSLFEHTWRPGPGARPVGTTTVKGQKGQFFFKRALDNTFRSFGIPFVTLPGDGGIAAEATGLENFLGNTPFSFAFDAQLREWRAWRDSAFKRGENLGTGGGAYRRQRPSGGSWKRPQRGGVDMDRKRRSDRERAKRYRDRNRDKIRERDQAKNRGSAAFQAAKAAERTRFENAVRAKYPNATIGNPMFNKTESRWYIKVGVRGPGGVVRTIPLKGRIVSG